MTKMIQTQNLPSSLMIEEETMVMQKQGIVTILGSDCDTNLTPSHHASSLRRTLSADMSSKKWLSQNMMKKISSSQQLFHSSKTIADSSSSSSSSSSSEDEAEAERERLEIWSSIQRNKKEEQEKAGAGAGAFDMWNSLVSLKDNNEISKSLPVTPYIHPLVKRSKSCLSEKSLEICTESLGSETGSDHGLFSSYPASETGETEEEKEQEHHQQQQEEVTEEEEEEPRYNHGAAKKFPPRSFPPPLPSLSRQNDGPSLHMRSRRDNGRLVLEAVSVPSQNNFCAQRQDGRLVLSIANHEETKEDADDEVAENDDGNLEELEEVFGEHEEGEDEAEDETESVIEKAEPLMSSEITTSSVRSLALMMNKPIGLVNRNPKWSKKFNEVDVNVVEVEVEKSPLAQSLPPRPRVARLIPSTPATAAAASFNYNAYEYYWRTKPTAKDATLPNIPLAHQQHNNNNNNSALNNINSTSKFIVSGDLKQNSNERQQFLVLRRKNGDYLVHNLESCKDSRRSFMLWKPYCIAT